jgi:hypothetical protein
MLSTVSVIKGADDVSLLTTYEARLGLNMASSSDETIDDLLEMLIKWSSDEIAVLCNRVFSKETVKEVAREIDQTICKRIYLSHYPIVEIASVTENGVPLVQDVDFEVDVDAGRLNRLNGTWSEPVTIIYTGGYELPNEAPSALQQAAMLMTREAYYASTRGDATIRMVSHKDSRIIYFDPTAAMKAAGSSGGSAGSPARRAILAILEGFTSYWV